MTLTRELEAFYEQFFVLGEGFTRGAFRVDAVDELDDPISITRAEKLPTRAIRFRRDEGHRRVDFVGTTSAVLNLVSDRLLNSLRSRRLTGWTTYSVEVADGSGERIDGYHGLAIAGRCGAIDDSLSPQVILPPPVPGGRAATGRRGLLFEHGSWDGSDLFCGEQGATMFMTARAVVALREDGITNVSIRRVLDVERTWNADGSLLP